MYILLTTYTDNLLTKLLRQLGRPGQITATQDKSSKPDEQTTALF